MCGAMGCDVMCASGCVLGLGRAVGLWCSCGGAVLWDVWWCGRPRAVHLKVVRRGRRGGGKK